MACGCPVVAPRAGGIPSLVTEGETALLYAPGDLEGAVRATRTMLDDGARLGAAARAVVETWDWEHSIDRVRQVYVESIREFQNTETKLTLGQRLAQAVAATLVFGFGSLSRDGRAGR